MARAHQFVDDEPSADDDGNTWGICYTCRFERPTDGTGYMRPHRQYLEWQPHGLTRGERAGIMVYCSGSRRPAMVIGD